jgi:hypothetical protein
MSDGLQKFPELSSMFWRGTWNVSNSRTDALSMSLGLGSSTKESVSVLLSFHFHYFSAPSEQSLQKNYLKISLQFPAGDIQLSGRSYLCL